MWNQVKKFAPFIAVLGYLSLYYNKGWDKVLTDLQTISVEKLQAKWHNIAIAIAAGVAIYFIGHVKLPAAFKAIILIFLYFVLGYNLGFTIDPPSGNGTSTGTSFYRPARLNPYAYGMGR